MKAIDISDEIMCKSPSGNKIYWLITTEIGAPNFEMRYIEIPPGGKTSDGSHPHEHEVFIIKGNGVIKGENMEEKLLPGRAIFVKGGERHQWINSSDKEPLALICVIPKGAEDQYKPPCDK